MSVLRVVVSLLMLAGVSAAEFNIAVDCAKGASLPKAVAFAPPDTTIKVSGSCTGPVVIIREGIKIDGGGTASVSSLNGDGFTVNGATRVALNRIKVTQATGNGVTVENGAQVSLLNTTISGALGTGLEVTNHSSATLQGATVSGNAVFGIDVETSSSLLFTGQNSVTGNGIFGIQINNGSSLNLHVANVTVSNNLLGIQMGTNASGFLDFGSTLNTSRNLTDGLTIVSGSHVVNFGGTIQSDLNGFHGISINSKAGLDMDAGSAVNVSANSQDGIHMERESSMTIFNNPAFSGNPGVTTLQALGNNGNGINVLTNSGIQVSNYAQIQSTSNFGSGVVLDVGISLSFTQTVPVSGLNTVIESNNGTDLLMSFGSRLTLLSGSVVGTFACDATVLARGPGAPTCPH